jgi:hypothetical protein
MWTPRELETRIRPSVSHTEVMEGENQRENNNEIHFQEVAVFRQHGLLIFQRTEVGHELVRLTRRE